MPERFRTSSHPDYTGIVNPEIMYSLPIFKTHLGITDATLRAARREGLKVYRKHKRCYVYGQDWIDYVRQSP